MDPRRALTERNAHFTQGPRFFWDDGKLMFEFVIDAGNVIGPRLAVKADQGKHPGAWSQFTWAEELAALDRDADGAPGGSLPAEPKPAVEQKDGQPAKRQYRRKARPDEPA